MRKQIGIIILIILLGIGIWYGFQPTTKYDYTVYFYSTQYKAMAQPEYLAQLRIYCINSLNDSIEELNYTELLAWEQRHIIYIPNYDTMLSDRRNMPIDILNRIGDGTTRVNSDKMVMGRCGEFSLLYTGLCLANGIQVKLIVDESKLYNVSKTGGAGDHMWNEVFTNGTWIHVDPTQNKINDPKMYVRDWNKDVNEVYAIEGSTVTMVTATYQ